MKSEFEPILREWAIVYLDDLRACLQQELSVYERFGAEAFKKIDETIEALRRNVLHDHQPRNPAYARQADLAAGLIILGMEYPDDYAKFLGNALSETKLRTFNGACHLFSTLNAIADDHDFVLIEDSQGSRLCHGHGHPNIARTCSRDLAAAVSVILEQRGFLIAHAGPEKV